jgi:hypothetical protein
MTQRPTSLSPAPSPRRITPGLALLIVALCLPAPGALATKTSLKAVPVVWNATLDGKPAGTETLRTVHSASGKVYASGSVVPPEKDAVRLITHQQRDANGAFKKYRREEKVRLGVGIFAFRKGGVDRIVGLNQHFEAAELAHIGAGPVWDSKAWHTLAHWIGPLGTSDAPQLTFLDISRRERREAYMTSLEARGITSPKKERLSLRMWKIRGLSASILEVGWLPDGSLGFVSDGKRELLRDGYSWKEPPPPPEPDPAPDSDNSDGADDGSSASDGEVAPEVGPTAPSEDATAPSEDTAAPSEASEGETKEPSP